MHIFLNNFKIVSLNEYGQHLEDAIFRTWVSKLYTFIIIFMLVKSV